MITDKVQRSLFPMRRPLRPLLCGLLLAAIASSGLVACGGGDVRDDDKVVEKKPPVPPAYVTRTGMEREALESFREAQAELEKGDEADKARATKLLEAVLEQEPEFAEAHYNLGLLRMEAGQLEAAREHLEKARDLAPEIGEYAVALARAYAMVDEFDKANEIFRAVLASEPDNLEAKNNLAILAYKRDDFDEAKDFIREILREDDENVDAMTTLGLIYNKQKNYNLAEYLFKQALCIKQRDAREGDKKAKEPARQAPKDAAAGVKKAEGGEKVAEASGAKTDCVDAGPEDPVDADLWNNLGQVYLSKGELPSAVQAFKKANESDAAYVESRLNLGAVLIEYLDYERANQAFGEALKVSPNHCVARLGKAATDYALNNAEASATGFQYYVENCDKEHLSSYQRLAKLYETQLNDMVKAANYYDRVVELASDEQTRANAKAMSQFLRNQAKKQQPKEPAAGAEEAPAEDAAAGAEEEIPAEEDDEMAGDEE